MALELVNSGPKMDWTMDTKIYDRYLQWKYSVELIFSSALSKATPAEKSSYIRLWMGPEAMPLIQKWTSTGKIDFSTPEEIPGAGGRARVPLSNGFIIQTFWDLLEEELKPKGNKLISILELLSDKSKQGSKPLNDWLSYVYNLVETCNYGVSKDRIIRDILFKGCASAKAKDTIIRRGDQISLADVIEILQTEDATSNTHETIKEIDSTTRMDPVASVHYASYENNKKSKKKHHSTEQNTPSNNSTKSSKSCFRCGKPYFQGHDAECKAIGATCNECFKTGHFQIVCGSLGRLPKRVQKPNSTDRKTAQQHSISDAPAQAPVGFYNEQGNWVAEPPRPSPSIQTVHSLSVVHPVKTFKTFKTFIQKPIQKLPSRKEWQNLKFLSENPSRRSVLQRSKFLPVQVRNCMQSQWKSSLYGRVRPNPPVLPSYRFPSNLKEIRTFRILQMFLSRASVTQKQIQKPPPMQIQVIQRNFKFLISEMIFKEREK